MSNSTIAFIISIILLLGVCSVQAVKIADLNTSIANLSAENNLLDQTLKDEQTKFKQTLQRLQEELAQYTLDADAYECAVSCKAEAIDKKTKEEEERINRLLESNSSSDNQLDIARRMLDEFNRNNKD